MRREEIEKRVLAVFKKNKRLGSSPLGLGTTFEELKLESLDVISIVFDLEDEFQISIPDQEALRLRTIVDAVEGIAAVLGHGKPP